MTQHMAIRSQSKSWALIVGCALTAAVSSGCTPETGRVSGRVTYRGQPVTSGTVLFHSGNDLIVSGLLDSDGNYTVNEVPVGPVRIAVIAHPSVPLGFQVNHNSPRPDDAPRPEGEGPGKKVVAIPRRYGYPEQSGLTHTVTSGNQTVPIVLTP